MTRMRIVHRTGFTYAEPATASYNEARMLPHSLGGQYVLQAGLEISPSAAQHSYEDYFGTRVSTFEVLTPHTELAVTATSVVDVRPSAPQPVSYSWEELAAAIPRALEVTESLEQTEFTLPDDEMTQLAQRMREAGGDVERTALEICRVVGKDMEFRKGVTGVHSRARDTWPERSGVCQDIVHIAIGVLRAAGIPARYVSGYLHPDPSVPIGQPVDGESHAWVEWFAGQWRGFDPTNLIDIGERHVFVGFGRDYFDVAPLRGVYAGPDESDMFVSIELTRLD